MSILHPRGIYVALQWAKSVYSNVDVFAGISAFYGALVSPSGDTLTRDYINSLMGVSISIDTMIADVGPTFFRVGTDGPLIRGIQFNVGKSVSYGLIPISLPITVTLDNESGMTNIDGGGGWTGFYPIVEWDVGTLTAGKSNQSGSDVEWNNLLQIQEKLLLILLQNKPLSIPSSILPKTSDFRNNHS